MMYIKLYHISRRISTVFYKKHSPIIDFLRKTWYNVIRNLNMAGKIMKTLLKILIYILGIALLLVILAWGALNIA